MSALGRKRTSLDCGAEEQVVATIKIRRLAGVIILNLTCGYSGRYLPEPAFSRPSTIGRFSDASG